FGCETELRYDMDTSGPALVPEWLKGLKARSNHKDPSQVQILRRNTLLARAQKYRPSLIDQDAPKTSASKNEAFQRYCRSSSGAKYDCSDSKKGAYVDQRTCHGFNQKSSFSGYDELKRLRDLKHNFSERLWEPEQQNVRGRKELNGDDRDRNVNRDDACRYHTLCNTSYQGSNSVPASRFKANKNLKNGPMDSGKELNILPTTSYASSFVSIGQKSDFERRFPSLGTEKKHGNSNSNQGNIWQEKIGMLQPVRPLLGSTNPDGLANDITGSEISGFGADGRVSVLADVSKLGLLGNNNLSTSAQIISPVRSVPSTVPRPASIRGLNMAEALAQNVPRDCTSPKLNSETQKLEELALKQSRQLIPIIRSTTKTMDRCSSRKLKSKLETVPYSTKVRQHVASSNQTTSVQAQRRPEYTEHGQGRNPMKDKAVSTSIVEVSTGSKSLLEENGFAIDEKKLWLQEKNDFFDSLRKRDTQNLLSATGNEEPSSSTRNKVNGLDGKSLLGVKSLIDVKRNIFSDSGLDNSEKVVSGLQKDNNEIKSTGKGVTHEKGNSHVKNMDGPVCPDPMNCISFMGSSEEEETAFMRSLGWDEHAEVKPLTEKEITAFYEQNLEALNAFYQGKQRLHFPEVHVATVARTASVGSFEF
ncbi:hypothetical protein KI387_023255, partial [Taxus chinensis]